MANFHSYNGSTLAYCATETGTYKLIPGIKSFSDIGGSPNKIDTTTLDNLVYETSINGLMPAVELEFEFNLEDPSAESNYYLASQLEDSGATYYWELTLSNGIVIKFQSAVRTAIKGGASDELIGFTMYLSPVGEIEKEIPTVSA